MIMTADLDISIFMIPSPLLPESIEQPSDRPPAIMSLKKPEKRTRKSLSLDPHQANSPYQDEQWKKIYHRSKRQKTEKERIDRGTLSHAHCAEFRT